jgi:FHA domain-containing protein
LYLFKLICHEMLMLELRVLSYSGAEPIVPIAVVFVDGQGTIGRSPENTLVLPDPERHVSRTQASIIALGQGRYEIENVSAANPIFVGSAEVESRARVVFRAGDELRIGLYVIGAREVTNTPKRDDSAHQQTAPIVVARDPISQPLAASIPLDFDPFALPSAASRNSSNPLEEFGKSNVVSLRGILEQTTNVDKLIDAGPPKAGLTHSNPLFDSSPSGIGEAQSLDPLKLFGGSGGSIFSNTLGVGIEAPASNHASELASFLNLPKPQSREVKLEIEPSKEPSLQRVQTADLHLPGFSRSAPAGDDVNTSPAGSAAEHGHAFPNTASPQAVSAQTGNATTESAFGDRRVANAPANAEPKKPLQHSAVKIDRLVKSDAEKKSAAGEDLRSPRPNNEALLKALLEGAGVPDLDFPQELDEALMRKIGMLLQVSVSGAVDMIQARAITKKELRADVTMIVSSGNNPLKFAPDGQAAMMQLLGRPFRGFMPPVEAVKDAFDDLRAHQIGVIVGTRAALGDVFQRFNPKKLEDQLTSPSMAQALVPSVRKAKLWALYTEMFAQIASEAEDDFQALFGKAFRTAYEAEVNSIKNARHE